MKPNDPFFLLREVRSVEPPPFLYTRIEAKIHSAAAARTSSSWMVGLATSLTMLLLLNAYVLSIGAAARSKDMGGLDQLTSGMGIELSNQLYHD